MIASTSEKAWSYSLAKAAAFGLGYGAIQAVLPPMGELEVSFVLHLALLVAFLVTIARPFRFPLFSTALACYVAVLWVAIELPFKYLDSRVELPAAQFAVSKLPGILQASGYPVVSREKLPAEVVHVTTARPSLKQLDAALRPHGFFLRPMPGCANALSLSFLWGPRARGRRLILRRL